MVIICMLEEGGGERGERLVAHELFSKEFASYEYFSFHSCSFWFPVSQMYHDSYIYTYTSHGAVQD